MRTPKTKPKPPHAAKLAGAAAAIVVALAASLAVAQPPYADTEWHTIHATSRNDDYVPTTIAEQYEEKWTVLEGNATLMGPSIGPEGNLYITTPSGPGTSTLHALDSDGNFLWQSDPWTDATGLDSCAGYQTPVIDDQGDVYLSDCNQLWSFANDGTVRWNVDLPAAPEGAVWQDIAAAPVNSFVTAMITLDGSVGGVTIWGDIVIASREDGALVAPVTKLPGSVAVSDLPVGLGISPPPGIWEGGLMDPEMIPIVWYVFDGVTPSANTPAVHPETGRIFVTGFSEPLDDDLGALYGIDFMPGTGGAPGTVTFPLNFVMGPGSGSSPGISPDGDSVYVSDGEGTLYSVNADTGAENWSLDAGGQPASPSVGPDGKIYLLGGKAGQAINPDGTLAWEANLDALAAEFVPELAEGATIEGPSTFNNAIPTITDDGILTSVTLGYLGVLGEQIAPLPVVQVVALLDADTGELREGFEPIMVADTVEGFVIPSLEGTLYVNNGALASSTLAVSGAFFAADIPEGVTLIEPRGGLQAFSPLPSATEGGGGCTVRQSSVSTSYLFAALALALAFVRRRRRAIDGDER